MVMIELLSWFGCFERWIDISFCFCLMFCFGTMGCFLGMGKGKGEGKGVRNQHCCIETTEKKALGIGREKEYGTGILANTATLLMLLRDLL